MQVSAEPMDVVDPHEGPGTNETGRTQDMLTYEIGTSLSLIAQEHIKSALLLSSVNLVPLCEEYALKRGVRKFVQRFDPELLVKTCKACNLDGIEPNRLESYINSRGVPEFLRGHSHELIRQFALKLAIDDIGDEEKNCNSSLKVLLEDISDEIMLQGMEDWLKSFPRDLLEKWCTDLGIKFCASSDLADKAMVKIFSLKPLIEEDEPAELETAPTATTAGERKKDTVENSEKASEDTKNGPYILKRKISSLSPGNKEAKESKANNSQPKKKQEDEEEKDKQKLPHKGGEKKEEASESIEEDDSKKLKKGSKRKRSQSESPGSDIDVPKKRRPGKHLCPPLSNIKDGKTKDELLLKNPEWQFNYFITISTAVTVFVLCLSVPSFL